MSWMVGQRLATVQDVTFQCQPGYHICSIFLKPSDVGLVRVVAVVEEMELVLVVEIPKFTMSVVDQSHVA